jgi:hypothetical protein
MMKMTHEVHTNAEKNLVHAWAGVLKCPLRKYTLIEEYSCSCSELCVHTCTLCIRLYTSSVHRPYTTAVAVYWLMQQYGCVL